MPVNKNAQLRHSVIDSCLQRTKRVWRFDDLLEAVADKYREMYGKEKSVSIRTLRADISDMRPGGSTGYEAPIEYSEERGYHYSVSGYSIFQSPITLDDLPVLRQVLTNLQQLVGLGLSEELGELVHRLEYRLSQVTPVAAPSIIQFEVIPAYTGLQWLAPLYQAIRLQQVVALSYQPFHKEATNLKLVHPHLLKQYNHRWFLLGVEDEQPTRLCTFALDRIKEVEVQEGLPYYPIPIDPDTYFQHIIGAAVPENTAVELVHLRFAASRAPYVLTKPLHPSQRFVGQLEVELRLIPTRELMSQLLSFGADVQVLEPAWLREKVQERLRESLRAYGENN